MSPKPFTENSQREYDPHNEDLQWCDDCQAFYWRDRGGHRCEPRPVTSFWDANSAVCTAVIIVCAILAALIWSGRVDAKTPSPIPAPPALRHARAACPVTQPARCRAALVHAYLALRWQRSENLKLAREMLGNITAWRCIHRGEGAWNATGFYHGGLQMDWPFMRTYGRDMLTRHAGIGAEAWTPREQIIVAQRAFVQGRGYAPWPQTSHACGLR